MAATTCFKCIPVSANPQQMHKQNHPPTHKHCDMNVVMRDVAFMGMKRGCGYGNGKGTTKRFGLVRCSGIGIGDFIGGDLVRPDLGRWLSDIEEHKALAIYTPHEGGYEGRYLNRLRYQGYYFLDLTARGLGDPETTLTKIHPVCPVSISF